MTEIQERELTFIVGGGGGGKWGLSYKCDRDARRKIQVKPLEESNTGVWLKLKLTRKGHFCVISVRAFFVNFFMHNTKRYLNGQIMPFHPKHPK